MFDIDSCLQPLYNRFPEAGGQPVIGLTTNYGDGAAMLLAPYYKQVVNAGAVPVLLPPVGDPAVLADMLQPLDGIIFTGGADYNPLWAGEEPSPSLHTINRERDRAELLLCRLAFNRQLPMLGICRGIQTLAMALGGHVRQDIGTTDVKHSQDADRHEPTHSVRLVKDSVLSGIYKTDRIFVNSFHHQAVDKPGPRLRVIAKAADGTVEAVESSEMKAILGVQWHPEWLEAEGLKVFRWLAGEARLFHEAKELHHRILTLDTHCDTPMFFPQGIDFAKRDPRILYDLHKMTEGRTDAVTMVAYLPQPRLGETFSSKIDLAGISRFNPSLAARYITTRKDGDGQTLSITPDKYADLIFDKIESIVNDNNRYVSIARTPSDLYEDKRRGRKSIMLGIENGLALNHDLQNVKHFAQRGIAYITLCHNGDNDVCDSARGTGIHGGVSAFGEKVIQAMNDEGIMVDLSHAAETSFYDALDISRTPIVCSHSNCRSLCDVPRNLSDDQLRALAKKGGVAHTTLYHGFLRKEGEATVADAITHLEHAIDVMGIDHVGLGTDFDGDGGVRGLADASELILFTIHLLRRRYSDRDIAKIWGGNWLRVMAQVQSARTSVA